MSEIVICDLCAKDINPRIPVAECMECGALLCTSHHQPGLACPICSRNTWRELEIPALVGEIKNGRWT